jgi:hypothetical protein
MDQPNVLFLICIRDDPLEIGGLGRSSGAAFSEMEEALIDFLR